MDGKTNFRAGRASLAVLAVAAATAGFVAVSPTTAGAAKVGDTPIPPPNCMQNDPKCYKEIRVVNNTNKTLYVVIQGSIQKTIALGNCPQGDVWLQRALNDTRNCYIVNSDYYAYVNPETGIKPGQTISVSVPWFSKTALPNRKDPKLDPYIDWWRGGRIYMFDDKVALDESYAVNGKKLGNDVDFDAKSPRVKCNAAPAASRVKVTNACIPDELKVYRAKPDVPGSQIQDHTPYQLNEWTFADVTAVENGGNLITLNLNYNVSNVDQVYLPVALEAITPGFTVGYLGTTSNMNDFQNAITKFIGSASKTKGNKTFYNWPIYYNPIIKGKPKYPLAGVRIPSTPYAFSFYMNPSYINGNDGSTGRPYWPTMISSSVPTRTDPRPPYFKSVTDNWNTCTGGKATAKTCPKAALYAPIKAAFDYSYQQYVKNCWKGSGNSPDFMAPKNAKAAMPEPKNLDMYLRFVYGWVPIRLGNIKGPKIDCTVGDVPDLPHTGYPPGSVSNAPTTWGNAIVNYMNIQYDWQIWKIYKPRSFNPYAQFVHDSRANGGLEAASYAFSIDDHASYRGDPGTGLIFAVGGPAGLPNPNPVPPPLPLQYDWYTASLSLGTPYQGASRTDRWTQYSLCDGKLRDFPNPAAGTVIGLDPTTITAPCTIILKASSQDLKTRKTTNKTYQLTFRQMNATGEPPYKIWNTTVTNGTFDPKVLSCSGDAYFCSKINQLVTHYDKGKPQTPPVYKIIAPTPFPLPSAVAKKK